MKLMPGFVYLYEVLLDIFRILTFVSRSPFQELQPREYANLLEAKMATHILHFSSKRRTSFNIEVIFCGSIHLCVRDSLGEGMLISMLTTILNVS